MENLFIKEVVGGKLVEISRMTVSKMLLIISQTKNLPEHEQLAHLMCSVTKVDGEKLNVKEFMESEDMQLFNFISESFNAMNATNFI